MAESVKQRTGVTIKTAEVDADDVAATAALIERVQPKLVVNLALHYQDLSIMEACLKTGVHYMATDNYESRAEAKFEYHCQWADHDRLKNAVLMALLGSDLEDMTSSDSGNSGSVLEYLCGLR